MNKFERLFTEKKSVVIIAIICNILWGSAIPFIKMGYTNFNITTDVSDKILFAGIRFFMSGIMVLLAGAILKKKKPAVKKENIMYIFMLGLVQTTIQYIFFYIGVSNTPSANSSIINSTTTFISVILAHFAYKDDRLNKDKIIGSLIGFIGVLSVTMQGGQFRFSFEGEGFIIIAALAFSVSGIMNKVITNREDSMFATGYNLLFGGLVLICMAVVMGGNFDVVNAKGIIVLMYLSLLSALGYTLWAMLLKYNPLGKICIYNFIIPVAGVILSSIVLKDNILQFKYLFALVCVCTGIIIVNRKKELTK